MLIRFIKRNEQKICVPSSCWNIEQFLKYLLRDIDLLHLDSELILDLNVL